MPLCIIKKGYELIKKIINFNFSVVIINFNILFSDEKVDAVIDQIQIISQDLKTLEKAFYKKSDIIDKNKSSK